MTSIADHIKNSGLSIEQIADRTGVDLARVKLLADGRSPTLTELRLIAKLFNLPLTSFAKRHNADLKNSILFRQSVSSYKKHKNAISHICDLVDLSVRVLPAHNEIPHWINNIEIPEQTYEYAELSALMFRDLFFNSDHYSPIYGLPDILNDKCNIIQFVIDGYRIDGASLITKGYPFIFLSPRYPARMFFTMAHELGHIIAHHKRHYDNVLIDTPNKTKLGKIQKNVQENFANAFASCLLMPQQGCATALQKVRKHLRVQGDNITEFEILYISHIFGVSFDVAAYRLEQLQLLPAGTSIEVTSYIRKEFGSAEKRAQMLDIPPMPSHTFPLASARVLDELRHAISMGTVSAGRVADLLRLPIDRLYDLTLKGVH